MNVLRRVCIEVTRDHFFILVFLFQCVQETSPLLRYQVSLLVLFTPESIQVTRTAGGR